jgi:ribosomal protein S10
MFININIKSKNKNSLIFFLKIFNQFNNDKKLKLNQTLLLSQKKKHKKIFTILKSPHVNKTAQEQFEFISFSKKIKIDTFQVLKTLIVLKKLQTTLFSDVIIKLDFIIDTEQTKAKLSTKFKPDSVISTDKHNLNYKQVELYLLLFHFHGKYKFIQNCLNSSVGRAKD